MEVVVADDGNGLDREALSQRREVIAELAQSGRTATEDVAVAVASFRAASTLT